MHAVTAKLFNRTLSKARGLIIRYQMCRSVCATILFRNYVSRWRKVAYAGPPPWDKRNEIISGFIPANSRVLDIGCGAQTLRNYLKPGCMYQPCDLIRSSAEVIYCDLNAGVYPEVRDYFDYVVCSGVFEYIRSPAEFLERVILLGNTLLMSYHPLLPGGSKFARLANNWVNHFTTHELENLFKKAGLDWTILHYDQGQYLYSVCSAHRHEALRQ